MKTHNVIIQAPSNSSSGPISSEGWFKQTTSTGGVETTKLFQRAGGEKSRSLGQKISDFFSGIKRAKDSVTLAEAFKGIKDFNSNTSFGGKFNVNLIPDAINKMAPEKQEDDLHTPKAAQEFTYGNYKLKLEDM